MSRATPLKAKGLGTMGSGARLETVGVYATEDLERGEWDPQISVGLSGWVYVYPEGRSGTHGG